jgi:hypothetical protein
MLNRLRKLLKTRPCSGPPAAAAAFWPGATLRLPPGAIIAEQGLLHLPEDGRGRAVQATMEEAFVVVRTGPYTQWYATWRPYGAGWDLLHLDDEAPAPPAAPPRLSRACG